MSSRCRFFWSRIARMRTRSQTDLIRVPPQRFIKNSAVPYMLGFSVFTWVGFDKKFTAEDDLINTIKHCIIFINRTDYEKAEQLLHIALRQAQQIRNELGITYIYDIMANLALERDQLDKAKQLFVEVTQRIMANGAKEDDPRVVHISTKLARISHLRKDYKTAQLGYEWCLDKLKTILSNDPSNDNKKLYALAEDWYGRLLLDFNQLEQGAKLMTNALGTMKEVSNIEPEHIVFQLNDIGTVYDQMGHLDESLNYFQEAINLAISLQIEDTGTMYVNIGRVYLKKQLLDEARKNCGYGWKLGVLAKNKDVKHEAELCLKEIKKMS